MERAPDLGTGIARVAEQVGKRLAVSDGLEELTYTELIADARALAATLPGGGSPTAPLALLLPHRARTVVAIVAALIAGRAPCVINPAQPRRRVEALLEMLGPEAVWVEDARLRRRLRAVGISTVSSVPTAADGRPADGGGPRPGPEDLCGIYLTSGSSGMPKAVGYAHGATQHRAALYAAALDASPDDRFSLVSPLWTAASASALFTSLLRGASLHLLDPARMAPAQLGERVATSEITVWHSTPSLFRRLAATRALERNRFRAIRLGGEPMLRGDLELVRATCADEAILVRGYSLTEANGAVTQVARPIRDVGEAGHLRVGAALDGMQVRIESEDGAPCATGEEGEIVVGGLLSAGYLGAPSADGTRFDTAGGATVLRTGDRGVLRADGSLEVRGRSDRRVKIRGHRIDPVEVEAAALRDPAIRDAVAAPFPRGGADTALALYAVAEDDGGAPSPTELHERISETLAPEARPAVVEVLDELPLTAAGKVDRGELARRATSRALPGRRRGRVDPVEIHLARLWREALEVNDLGPDEDFFGLGGDSLAAAEVCAGIESTYGLPLEPAVLLRHRTLTELATQVRQLLDGDREETDPVLRLNPGGRHRPLFVVPGAGSEATALVHLAEAVGPEQPVNVIQLPGADGRSRPLTSMKAVADHCVSAIRSTGARPPHLVAGTSFGGLAAYAAASRLLENSETVAYLGLFDAPAPFTRPHRYLVDPLRRFRRPPNLTARELARHPRIQLRRLRLRLRELLVGYRLPLSLILRSDWRPPAELRFRYLRVACSMAASRWTPPPASGRVHLYRCESQPPHLEAMPFLGWERHASDITVRPLPTRHGRHIRSPGVAHLARALAADLENVRERDGVTT